MATRTNNVAFPAPLVAEMFSTVQGHSALAKLSASKPIPFNGETEMIFSMNGEKKRRKAAVRTALPDSIPPESLRQGSGWKRS